MPDEYDIPAKATEIDWKGRKVRKARIGSHMPKKPRNRKGKRYYKGGGYSL